MAVEEQKKEEAEESAENAEAEAEANAAHEESAKADVSSRSETKSETKSESVTDEPVPQREIDVPGQLGSRRFVYAAYFAGAILVAFLVSKLGDMIWYRLQQWKPDWNIGDPNEPLIMLVSAVVGGIVAFYYWRRADARKFIEEVASELSQVTWPDKKAVTNSTFVTIVVTIFATVFFALMDRFWGFVTNLVYGT